MCFIELEKEELQKEIIHLKQSHLKEKCKLLNEIDELKEIIDEIKSCLYFDKIPDDFEGEASTFYDFN